MQNHTKVYYEYFNYIPGEYIECEIPGCGCQAVDIHHIIPRSKFGSKRKDEQDDPKNLIGLCRKCHDKADSNEYTDEYLQSITENR